MPAGRVDAGDDVTHHSAERLVGRALLAHLGHHVQPLGPRPLALDADRGRVADAGDVIDELTLVYNKNRQAGITKELSEIVGGAAAV